jgi:hypothetical protein
MTALIGKEDIGEVVIEVKSGARITGGGSSGRGGVIRSGGAERD